MTGDDFRKYQTSSPRETQKLGRTLARKFFSRENKKRAKIISLEGELGGGKTTFLKGVAKALGIKEEIKSPSFIIIKRYPINSLKWENFFHIDCWRIKSPKEILDLGWEKIISNPKNIVAIEWGEKIKKILPPFFIKIRFKILGKNEREITIFLC